MSGRIIAVEKIPVWQDRPPGPDLIQHSWAKNPDGHYYRLCDHAKWMELPEVDCSPGFWLSCMQCSEAFDSSSFVERWGPLPFRPKGTRNSMLPVVARYNMEKDQAATTEDCNMPHMNTLIAFSLLEDGEQAAFVQQLKARKGGSRSHFVSIVKELHWDTHDIYQLENLYKVFIYGQLNTIKARQRCQELIERYLIERYIETWNRLGCIYIPPPQAHQVTIQGLPILVKPEVGARPHETRLKPRLIKLWLRSEPVSDTVCSMASYLMDRLGQQHGWGGSWRPEVWDVGRRGVVSSPWDSLTEARVHQAARRYVELLASQ